nr:hypothetical protein [Tanacetum cinerariifolium]
MHGTRGSTNSVPNPEVRGVGGSIAGAVSVLEGTMVVTIVCATSSTMSLGGVTAENGKAEIQLQYQYIVSRRTNLRVAFNAINARRLPLAPLVYTLVRPSMTASSANNLVFRGFFQKQKLTGPSFIDWYRQLRIVLSIEDKLNYLEQPIPPTPVVPAGQHQAEHELLQTTRDFHSCKQEEGQSVSSYVLKIKGYINNLERLGHPVTPGLGVSLILIGLHTEFDGFVQNYSIHSPGKTINELHAMLKLQKQTLLKNNAPALHAIRGGKYLVELLKKKKNTTSGAGGSGIFVIKLNTILNRSWIYDSGCGTHICNTTQGLRASRKLKPGALSLYVGNGQREAVEAIDVFYLCLPSGLEIVLNNCYYAPSITRGVISVFRSYEDGFINRFVNNTIQVFRNNMVYFSGIPRDGIFEIDLSNSYTNESSIYAVSNKKAKLDLDSALLWHCRLGHISKKRIEKLQHDGLIDSTDLRAFEKCVSCMSGKMARKPYTHQVERAKDLLGLIHTDEVENQLGKTIKSLRFDRGGEYMSQEFLVHLKDHGIITHRTPPYTPQHNGVSDRRNRTLLDMVRSKMSQTTLPKSFWDYALETAARILNMVTSKKVEKTSYKVWHGQSPKLSYLKVWCCEALVKRDTLTKPDKSTRTRHAPDRMCLYIDAEEHGLGDIGEPANYKVALLDSESEKWLNAMNVEMQSIKDNEAKLHIFLESRSTEIDYDEAEYIAAFDASKKAVWVRKFISRLGVVSTIKEPISMYCDNTGAIAKANESGITKGARHFRAKVHYLREVIEYGDVKLEKVHTDDYLADHFTKALAFPKHSEHTRNIGMLSPCSIM